MTKINIEQICSITRMDKRQNYNYKFIKPHTFYSWFKKHYNTGGFIEEYVLSRSDNTIKETEQKIANDPNIYIEGDKVYFKPSLSFRVSSQQHFTKYFESVQELEQFLKEEVLFHIKTINI